MAVKARADSDPQAMEERRAARASMPIRRFALGAEPDENLVGSTTMNERLAMVWPLSRLAYELAGQFTEPAPRSQLAGRVVRRGVG
jgi:hypothetical protein